MKGSEINEFSAHLLYDDFGSLTVFIHFTLFHFQYLEKFYVGF